MSTKLTEESLALIEEEYCPPLDSTVVIAISHDYDTVEELREVLDILKSQTVEDDDFSDQLYSDWANVLSEDGTDPTTGSMMSDEYDDLGRPKGDLHMLKAMFPLLGEYTLKHTLEKNQGDVDRAIDELLNKSFLEEEGEGEKGIDGFAEDINFSGGKRKGRRKGKNNKQAGVNALSSEGSSSSLSKWDEVGVEVESLARALNLPKPTVASTFHKYGSRAASLQPLIRTHGSPMEPLESAEHLDNIHALAAAYPRVDESLLNGLLKLCKENLPTARELAGLLDRYERRKLTVVPPPPPPPLNQTLLTSPTSATSSQNAWSTVASRVPLPRTPTAYYTGSHFDNRSLATSHANARAEAYDKASAAHRRSKSDRYMGAVATYYADIGAQHTTHMKTHDALAAEALVDSNSTPYNLDLHGVTVQQAMTIARERVTEWWVIQMGTEGQKVIPFNIVTGLGRHSRNHESRVGPAVSKMLIREQWKIEICEGHIMVMGVKKAVVRK